MAFKYSVIRMSHSQYCSAPNCHNSRGKCPKMSFFRFPKDELRCKQWVENCGRLDLTSVAVIQMHRNRVLCCSHFEDSQFMNARSRNRLVWNAIPTIFDDPNPARRTGQENASGSHYFEERADDEGDFDFPAEEEVAAVAALVESQDADKLSPSQLEDADRLPPSQLEDADRLSPSQLEDPRPAEVSAADGLPAPRTTGGAEPNAVAAPDAASPENDRQRVSAVVTTPQQLQRIKMRQLINRQRVRLWRLKKQVESLKSRSPVKEDTVEGIIDGASKYLSGIAFNFFANQLRIASKKKQGKRWTKDDKLFALSLHLVSSEAYHLCSRVFSLPTARTLQRWLRSFRKQPNFEELELNPFKNKLMGKTRDGQVLVLGAEESHAAVNLTADDELVLEALNQCLNPSAIVATTSAAVDEEADSEKQSTEDGGAKSSNGLTTCSLKRTFLTPRPLNGNRAKSARPFQLQLHSDQIDAQTLKLITEAGTLTTTTTAMMAVQATTAEGPLVTDGVPITISEDTINLQIVTLAAPGETVNVLGLA